VGVCGQFPVILPAGARLRAVRFPVQTRHPTDGKARSALINLQRKIKLVANL
jgi:hypothetical protein